MAEEPENHTVRLLQEMRQEMREQFDNLNTRVDGITHILTLLAGHTHHLDNRVTALETKPRS
jgi:NifB/MoaA-like Fe-S oxidoreductase